MRRYVTVFAAAVLLCLNAGCSIFAQTPEDELAGTTWKLLSFSSVNADGSLGDRIDPDPLAGWYILEFGQDSGLGAQADCNRCGGTYQAELGGALSAELICTRQACNRSSEFSGAITTADRYEIVQGRLRIPYTTLVSGEKRILIFEPLDKDETAGAGIIFGQSIEGVTLKDDSSSVIQKLGTPFSFLRGDFPSVTYRYQNSPQGTEIEISTDPSVGKGVISICVHAPYEGETQQGVGIGTVRAKAHDVLGPPDNLPASAWGYNPKKYDGPQGWYDRYYFGDMQFRIAYHSDKKVHSICMEPLLEEKRVITNAVGTVVRRSGSSPRFVVVSDAGGYFGVDMPGWVPPPGNEIPEAFKEDGLRVVFSGRAFDIPRGVRLCALPMRLVSIEKLN